jgi:hypothetical protein
MELSNEIVLRPRFNIVLNYNNKTALTAFDAAKQTTSNFIISRIDDHVFIRIPKAKQHFWSPQLHLEINEIDEKSSSLHGLFGPNPTVWTMFMFLHFAIATLFIGVGIWAYTRNTLGDSIGVQISIICLLIVCWFGLYFAGRMGKKAGKTEMINLGAFMRKTLNI